jgi:hypothetical protein
MKVCSMIYLMALIIYHKYLFGQRLKLLTFLENEDDPFWERESMF